MNGNRLARADGDEMKLRVRRCAGRVKRLKFGVEDGNDCRGNNPRYAGWHGLRRRRHGYNVSERAVELHVIGANPGPGHCEARADWRGRSAHRRESQRGE